MKNTNGCFTINSIILACLMGVLLTNCSYIYKNIPSRADNQQFYEQHTRRLTTLRDAQKKITRFYAESVQRTRALNPKPQFTTLMLRTSFQEDMVSLSIKNQTYFCQWCDIQRIYIKSFTLKSEPTIYLVWIDCPDYKEKISLVTALREDAEILHALARRMVELKSCP